MTIRLIQLEVAHRRRVAQLENADRAVALRGVNTLRELAMAALDQRISLREAVLARRSDEVFDISPASSEVRMLVPIDHPDSAHLHLSGTGLTHLGSAASRDEMHRFAAADRAAAGDRAAAEGGSATAERAAVEGRAQTDSMRIFLQGLKGGKPAPGAVGVQPEWFYKGDGSNLTAPGNALRRPAFALDGGEEPEIAGIYLIDAGGNPWRLGFCLANEFSDHIMERDNYLWLAHSKIREAALGPELLTGELPANVRGTSRIVRDGKVIWEKEFLTGESNMSHSIANLEHHHFKYSLFRRPGDVHVHFFGCATLSYADGIEPLDGDIFDIRADAFLLPLQNRLTPSAEPGVAVRPL
ncbi:MAG TPA: AraD1 family protein [Steroidobacteraceae bacterium]|nr:AraD1 family protein [Steroidobacteraceae bacterium]